MKQAEFRRNCHVEPVDVELKAADVAPEVVEGARVVVVGSKWNLPTMMSWPH